MSVSYAIQPLMQGFFRLQSSSAHSEHRRCIRYGRLPAELRGDTLW